MIYWYYPWSPKYELFHRVLYDMLKDISGISVNPVFFEQSCFSKMYTNADHFFSGISVKQLVLVDALKKHKGEYVILSDADIVVKGAGLTDYLEKYKANDMTFMREYHDSEDFNAGFSMIKSTDETIAFYENIIKRIHAEDGLDQTIIREELVNYKGLVGGFSSLEISNVNQMTLDKLEKFKVIQLVCGNQSELGVMCEKVAALRCFTSIDHLIHLIPTNVIEQLNNR